MTQASSHAAAESLEAASQVHHIFRLYVNSATPASSRALVNVRTLFDRLLAGRYELQIINVAERVDLVRLDQVIASPTLIRLSPLPRMRFIGDMSDGDHLMASLSLAPPSAESAR